MTFKKIESIVDDVCGIQWLVDGRVCTMIDLYDISDIEKGQEGEYLIPHFDTFPEMAYKVIGEIRDGGKVTETKKRILLRDLTLGLYYRGFFEDYPVDELEIERHYSEK